MTTTAPLEDRSAKLVLDAAHEAVRARRTAEVAEMRITAHWCVMHGEPRSERDPRPAHRRTGASRAACRVGRTHGP